MTPSSPLAGAVVVVVAGAVVVVVAGAVGCAGLDSDDRIGDGAVPDPRADPSPATVVATAPAVVDTTPVTGEAVAPEID